MKSWLPDPADKYLPIWVIAAMSASVLLISCQLSSAVTELCKAQGDKCARADLSKPTPPAAPNKPGAVDVTPEPPRATP